MPLMLVDVDLSFKLMTKLCIFLCINREISTGHKKWDPFWGHHTMQMYGNFEGLLHF